MFTENFIAANCGDSTAIDADTHLAKLNEMLKRARERHADVRLKILERKTTHRFGMCLENSNSNLTLFMMPDYSQ